MVWGICYTSMLHIFLGLASFAIACSIVLGSLSHIAGVDGLQVFQQFDIVCNHQQLRLNYKTVRRGRKLRLTVKP